jgi:hypothetical protein
MLGKAEYVKFVLGSVCHERAKFFIVDKVLKNHVNIFNKISAIKGTAKERSAAFIKSSGWSSKFGNQSGSTITLDSWADKMNKTKCQ